MEWHKSSISISGYESKTIQEKRGKKTHTNYYHRLSVGRLKRHLHCDGGGGGGGGGEELWLRTKVVVV